MSATLLVIDQPNAETGSEQDAFRRWLQVAATLRKTPERNESVEFLGGNCWLLKGQNYLPFLTLALQLADTGGLPHRVAVLKHDPQWSR